MGQSSSKGSSEVSRTSPLSGLHHRQTEQAQLDHLSAAQRQSQAVCPSLSGRPVMHCTAQSGTVPAIPASEFASVTGRACAYTAYEANAWEATYCQSGVTILVDPWLVGELVFAGQRWAYHGEKSEPNVKNLDPEAIAARASFILLSQGLDDHGTQAHTAEATQGQAVHSLDHGQAITMGPLTIRATMGALVGPPWSKRENGFVISENVDGGMRLYYEPHCDYDDGSVSSIGLVDAIITPASTQLIGGFFPLVKGNEEIVRLIGTLKPQVVVPLINAGFHAGGPLSKIVAERGSNFDLPQKLKDNALAHVRVEFPSKSGDSKRIRLE
ncbi:hypothetical protein WJX84_001970 [Apatococcus fuscideae]|uniref:Metallo-beta-lactamase domain-containing protein n=1 Tax=Apatococcus fuscideae TaxID=2026836 RepID=A0AAW1T4D5_9CHLO